MMRAGLVTILLHALLACPRFAIAAPALSPTPRLETAPPGLRYPMKADTPDELISQAKPDVSWTDPDGAILALWARKISDGRWQFVVDRAYRLTDNGATFWAFLDPEGNRQTDREHPIAQFYKLRQVRSTIDFPTERRDGNQSAADRLAVRENGETVFKISYCSLFGERPHQEEIRTYLIYITTDGEPVLAVGNMGHEGSYPPWWVGHYVSSDLKVVWCEQSSPAPFYIQARWSDFIYSRGEDNPVAYSAFRQGILAGSFPLSMQRSEARYVEADGKRTLRQLAKTLRILQSTWVTADWVTNPMRERADRLWLEELQRLNPKWTPDDPIAEGNRIAIPNEQVFNRRIVQEIRGQ